MLLPRRRAIAISIASVLALAACASSGPAPLTQQELDAFSASVVVGATTVAEARALAPDGQVGMVEVRVSAGTGAVEHATHGSPPEAFHDWLVVGYCGSPQSVPSIQVAAVAPSQAQALADSPGFHLVCDGPPASPAEG